MIKKHNWTRVCKDCGELFDSPEKNCRYCPICLKKRYDARADKIRKLNK